MCAKFIEPSTAEIRVICDCASGFYGIDYCDPITDFVRLPPFFSRLAGAHLKHPALLNGAFDESNIEIMTYGPSSPQQVPQLQYFSIVVNNSLRGFPAAPVNVVRSAFKTIDQDEDTDSIDPIPAKQLSLRITINEPLSRNFTDYSALGMCILHVLLIESKISMLL